jgi:hypothetical protein
MMFGLVFYPNLAFEVPALVFLQIVEHPTNLIWWLVTMGGAHLMAGSLCRVSKQ